MSDTPSKFTVVDRRKFTMDGVLRSEQERTAEEASATQAQEEKKETAEPTTPPNAGPRLITMPKPVHAEETEEIEEEVGQDEPELPPPPSAEESRKQKSDYERSSADLDNMLRAANPGMQSSQQITFEHLVQQLYLSAMMQMGAGTPEGERPRVDILGARQTVDLVGVLAEKTKGNLNEHEDRMLQSALFELRMNFLELTNMISKSATQPPPGGKR
jgi:Domain of unknown function (DUF1844)